jgi:uncharacterized integral membrane protein (TIGR00698 family)
VAEVGLAGVLIAVLVMGCTLMLAVWLGRRLGLEPSTALLIGAGSGICGVAAVMATQSLARARETEVAMAVTTVVLFGTLAMLLYPWLYPQLGMSAHDFGLYAGATIHEVAQVVVVGEQVGVVRRGAFLEERRRCVHGDAVAELSDQRADRAFGGTADDYERAIGMIESATRGLLARLTPEVKKAI